MRVCVGWLCGPAGQEAGAGKSVAGGALRRLHVMCGDWQSSVVVIAGLHVPCGEIGRLSWLVLACALAQHRVWLDNGAGLGWCQPEPGAYHPSR